MLQLPEVLSSLQVIYLASHTIAVAFLEVKAQEEDWKILISSKTVLQK